MKKTILIIGAFMIFISISLKAQFLTPTVISSAGGFYVAGSATLSVTVAEMTMVETFMQSNSMLTQGFQQAFPPYVSIQEQEMTSSDVVIYPNPSNGQFTISYYAKYEDEYPIKIYNMVGQIAYAQSFSAGVGLNNINIDISRFRQGVYILELFSSDSNGKKNRSLHKINLVY